MMAPVIMGNADRPELADRLATGFCRNDPKAARHFAGVTFLADHRSDLPLVRTPSLILQCRDDALAPLAVGEYLKRELAGSELALMQATGHCPHMSAPEETVAVIGEYLDRQKATA